MANLADTENQVATPEKRETQLPSLSQPRLPYHPVAHERFDIDRAAWKALVEAIFPAAQSTESVLLALSYCRARKLDPFKRNVHIVPIWDSKQRKLVDTVWPGIGELRTTAFRTRQYAGRDKTVWGPEVTRAVGTKEAKVEVTFPEWAQVTVYRMIGDQRVAFEGPPVYWEETFSDNKSGTPNSMWMRRKRGQLDKCAEAAALRGAFPEEIGDLHTDDESGMLYQDGSVQSGPLINGEAEPRPTRTSIEDKSPRSDSNEDTPSYELIDRHGEIEDITYHDEKSFLKAVLVEMKDCAEIPEAVKAVWEHNEGSIITARSVLDDDQTAAWFDPIEQAVSAAAQSILANSEESKEGQEEPADDEEPTGDVSWFVDLPMKEDDSPKWIQYYSDVLTRAKQATSAADVKDLKDANAPSLSLMSETEKSTHKQLLQELDKRAKSFR